jgi:hypothetical protein
MNADSRVAQLMAAAESLPEPFTAEQVAEAVWKIDPLYWGLRGFENKYPDFHRVYYRFCGEKGLVKMRFLTKVPGGYRVTASVNPVTIPEPVAAILLRNRMESPDNGGLTEQEIEKRFREQLGSIQNGVQPRKMRTKG